MQINPATGVAVEAAKPVAQPRWNLVFYDAQDPEAIDFWAGISYHIIRGLRNAGQRVDIVGNHAPRLRRSLWAAWYHGYRILLNLRFIPDRHRLIMRLLTAFGNWKLRRYRDADAIVTVSPVCVAYLRAPQPIFVLHDATWGQIIETYPYFEAARQPRAMVRSGFELDRRAFGKANVHLVMTSQWAADRAKADYGIDEHRVHILPFGANFVDDPPLDTVRRGLDGRKGEHCRLLFVGREFERKGGPLAVATAARLNAIGIATTLHVVGCSPEDMPPFVHVHGLLRKSRPDELARLTSLYLESDFFLMPSRAEAQGIVFCEAAAYALPVAATDVGGVSAVVQGGAWGLLLPPEAPAAAYADWLAALFRDRARYRSVALHARDDYDTRLSNRAHETLQPASPPARPRPAAMGALRAGDGLIAR